MSLATAIQEIMAAQPGISDDDLLAELKARTVTLVGKLSGGVLSGMLARYGLLAFVQDKANTTGENSLIRNICVALVQRMLPDGEIDLSDSGNVNMLDAFLADDTVTGILTGGGHSVASARAEILTAASTVYPEFNNLRMVNVLENR